MPLSRKNPALARKISEMRLTIAPIVHAETGLPPPDFPSTLLQLFLLTEDQLDRMAAYYDQIIPTQHTSQYPQSMDWNRAILARPDEWEGNGEWDVDADECITPYERLKIKMRMFARFIGMRGAETPRWEYERQVDLLMRRFERSVRQGMESERKSRWYGTLQ
ncbi:hypothetical protein M011DRAFT_396325 [Sporormia fimetaria CBS 119925]|uniref:Uncharacterized protein n=1 Tax=Sporormia fimetaria CBS 119925 TaxID=1340428 RepID=A0A6A6VKH0_9PLEO|nr:hypothetical protein M011DRAFT_396325 [Sporormia fimetaria CBS 119925]